MSGARRRMAPPIATLLMTALCVLPSADSAAGAKALERVELPRPDTIRNPAREHAPDPSMVYYDGSYYLAYTSDNHIVVAKAASVSELPKAPATEVWDDDTPSRCCNMWSPELHLISGRWYLYYSADDVTKKQTDADVDISRHRMYVLESSGTDPLGPYVFKGELNTSVDAAAIDGTVLKQPDDSLYFIWSGAPDASSNIENLYLAPMSDPWTVSGERVLISQPEYDWEVPRKKNPHPGTVNEAPHILQHDGKVFLTYSGAGCAQYDYALGMLTLQDDGNPLDPGSWAKTPNPVFKFSPDHWAYAPGSNGFFSSPDDSETWLIYHALSSSDGTPVGECSDNRSTRIQRMSFDDDGTPNFGEPAASWQSITVPAGDPGAPVVPSGRYYITAAGKKSVEAKGCATDEHDEAPHPVDMWEYKARRCQQWNLEYLGDGSYKLTEAGSGGALEVRDCRVDNGAPVTVSPFRGDACQEWYLDGLGDGIYRISSRASGKALTVSGCSPENGAELIIWPYWNDQNSTEQCQRWELHPVG